MLTELLIASWFTHSFFVRPYLILLVSKYRIFISPVVLVLYLRRTCRILLLLCLFKPRRGQVIPPTLGPENFSFYGEVGSSLISHSLLLLVVEQRSIGEISLLRQLVVHEGFIHFHLLVHAKVIGYWLTLLNSTHLLKFLWVLILLAFSQERLLVGEDNLWVYHGNTLRT